MCIGQARCDERATVRSSQSARCACGGPAHRRAVRPALLDALCRRGARRAGGPALRVPLLPLLRLPALRRPAPARGARSAGSLGAHATPGLNTTHVCAAAVATRCVSACDLAWKRGDAAVQRAWRERSQLWGWPAAGAVAARAAAPWLPRRARGGGCTGCHVSAPATWVGPVLMRSNTVCRQRWAPLSCGRAAGGVRAGAARSPRRASSMTRFKVAVRVCAPPAAPAVVPARRRRRCTPKRGRAGGQRGAPRRAAAGPPAVAPWPARSRACGTHTLLFVNFYVFGRRLRRCEQADGAHPSAWTTGRSGSPYTGRPARAGDDGALI
jgi:hypothetical protein